MKRRVLRIGTVTLIWRPKYGRRTVAAIICLVLCLSLAVLWIRSYRTGDMLLLNGKRWGFVIESLPGYVSVSFTRLLEGRLKTTNRLRFFTTSNSAEWLQPHLSRPRPGIRTLGFGFEHSRYKGGYDWTFRVTYWALCALAAVWPFIWLVRLARRRHRLWRGHCANCGYDLRATPDRCPECGMPVPANEPTGASA